MVIEGVVKRGHQRGKTLGFATINIPVPRSVRKKDWGIYFTLVTVGERRLAGVTHLGPITMFKISAPRCETHLLNFTDTDLTRKKVTVRFLHRLRDIEHFDSVQRLQQQVASDIKAAKQFFHL